MSPRTRGGVYAAGMARTWRIGEVAERTGLTRRTLRHYDDLGLLVPSARSWSDYRLYDEDDLLRLLQIQNLKALGLSLEEIAGALADPAVDAAATLRQHRDHLAEQIGRQQQLVDRLDRLASTATRSWEDVLDAIALSRQLAHPNPSVRMRAALQPSGAATRDLVAAAVAEPVAGVRDALVLAISRQPDAVAAAVTGLDDPDPAVRRVLVRVLGKLREPACLPALADRLSDPDPEVVAAAVDGLGRLGDPAAAPALAGLLGLDVVAARSLTDALVGLGTGAAEAVAVRLGDPAPGVREHATEVLERLGVDPA